MPGVVVKLLQQDSSGNWTTVTTRDDRRRRLLPFRRPGRREPIGSQRRSRPTSSTARRPSAPSEARRRERPGRTSSTFTLAAGDNGTEYNFGEQGLQPGMVSLRMCLASAPPAAQIVTQLDAAPVVTSQCSAAGSRL